MAGKSSTVAFAIGAFVLVGIGVAVSVLMARHGAMKVGGRISVEGTSIGSFAFSPNDCVSGAAYIPPYLGANLRVEGGPGLRVVESGDKARLWVFPQGGRGVLTIDKPTCSQWDVLVDWVHETANRVSKVSGHVRVKCEAGGGTVDADVRFERCAQ